MSFIDYLGPFLLLLGILVVVHEFGHFAVAKWFNVKCERFSVGFGPSILRRQIGETEYVIAWLPLGGYVKMAGENPEEELPPEEVARSFSGQSPARRIAIALAGPGMNLLLSVVVVAGLYISGWPTPTSLIASVLPDSPAAEAGLQPGDRVVEIESKPVWTWQELTEAVQAHEGEPLELTVDRAGALIALTVVPGDSLGVLPAALPSMLSISDRDSPAARAGLETGDRVRALNGAPVRGWYELVRGLSDSSGSLEIEIGRDLEGAKEIATVSIAGDAEVWSSERLGVGRADFSVLDVIGGKPAERAGFLVGDLLLEIDGEPVGSFGRFVSTVRESEGRTLNVVVLREGRKVPLEVAAQAENVRLDGELQPVYRIGLSAGTPGFTHATWAVVGVQLRRWPGEVVNEVVRNPVRALWLGSERTASFFWMIVEGVRMLVTREVGVENLAGPIGIGQIAGQSFAEKGWFPFLWMMCLISVNLAILNLLPIPILDGGHIVFAVAEAVRGRAVGLRAREIAQTVGISLVILLMGFAFWNDISRNWEGIVGFFKNLI